MKNILDITKELNFSKSIILPVSKKEVTFRPLTVKDGQGLGVNGIETLQKCKFKSKNEFNKLYGEFKVILDNTIVSASDLNQSEVEELCFLDYVILFYEIRSKSEGEDDIIVGTKCKHKFETEDEKEEKCCNEEVKIVVNYEEDLNVRNLDFNNKYKVTLRNKDKQNVDYIFDINLVDFHSYMQLIFLTAAAASTKNSKISEQEVLDLLINILFKISKTVTVEMNTGTFNFDIMKELKKEKKDTDIDLESFNVLLSERLPRYVVKNLFTSIIEKQPAIEGEIEFECSHKHKDSLEVTTFDFFTLI